jgi:hypothetical protein
MTASIQEITPLDEIMGDAGLRMNCEGIKQEGGKDPSSATRLMAIPDRTELKSCERSMQRYEVFSRQHSGTTWLAGTLNHHPLFFGLHEILCCDHVDFTALRWRDVFYNYVCRKTAECSNLKDSSAFTGFVVQQSQGWGDLNEVKKMIDYYKSNNVKILFLERTNSIEHFLASSGGKKAGENVSELVDLDGDFLQGLQKLTDEHREPFQRTKDLLSSSKIPFHYVTYEDLVSRQADAWIEIYQFLGVDTTFWTTAFDHTVIVDPNLGWNLTFSSEGKHHKKTLKERIANYDEALAVLEEIYPNGACMLSGDCPYS